MPHLDPIRWVNSRAQIGHGYAFRLDTLECDWVPLARMAPKEFGKRRFYESPALIGCVLAIGRGLYRELWGFDAAMRSWGVEDIDFGLKAWLLGYPILHDPQAIVGHRFRQAFDNYDVPPADLLANQLRFARKHFSSAVWSQWVEACRLRNSGPLPGHPEGLWARAWSVFVERRESVEHERQYLMSRRVRDEFDYAAAYSLDWPRLSSQREESSAPVAESAPALSQMLQLQPSPSPPPPCGLTGISPLVGTFCKGATTTLRAEGTNLDRVKWRADGATPPSGEGAQFDVKWNDPHGLKTVYAECDGKTKLTVYSVLSLIFDKTEVRTGFKRGDDGIEPILVNCILTVEPKEAIRDIVVAAGGDRPDRIDVKETNRDESTGKIHFTVAGLKATPDKEPMGDTTIKATHKGRDIEGGCSEIPAIVVIPWSLKPPYPKAEGPPIVRNLAVNETTSPAAPRIKDPEVLLVTLYYYLMQIRVCDQFGEPLDPIYNGSTVAERFEDQAIGLRFDINQTIQNGVYTDPVGMGGTGTTDEILLKTDPRAIGWPANPAHKSMPAPPLNEFKPDIYVYVAGHNLRAAPNGTTPAIQNRVVIGTNPVQIRVTWPDPPTS